MNKPRIIRDYNKLTNQVVDLIKLNYPRGFDKKLILFKNKEGKFISGLPFETEDMYYLIRMTKIQAQQIIEDESDYDENGNLFDEVKDRLEAEHNNIDSIDYEEE